jgi:hypothetical protein
MTRSYRAAAVFTTRFDFFIANRKVKDLIMSSEQESISEAWPS